MVSPAWSVLDASAHLANASMVASPLPCTAFLAGRCSAAAFQPWRPLVSLCGPCQSAGRWYRANTTCRCVTAGVAVAGHSWQQSMPIWLQAWGGQGPVVALLCVQGVAHLHSAHVEATVHQVGAPHAQQQQVARAICLPCDLHHGHVSSLPRTASAGVLQGAGVPAERDCRQRCQDAYHTGQPAYDLLAGTLPDAVPQQETPAGLQTPHGASCLAQPRCLHPKPRTQ